MHPTLFTLPGGLVVQSYGLCLVAAFAVGILLACRRARLVKADPHVILDLSLLALLFGVGGARLLYVLHYWHYFADRPHPFLAVLDVRRGGLEFLGGFIAATLAILVYLVIARRGSSGNARRRPLSVRLYLDILTPSLMCGLAATRVGCFLNGCCFGGVCVAPGTQEARYPWALRFPYGSPPFIRQWEDQRIAAPAELIVKTSGRSYLMPRSKLSGSVEMREADEAQKSRRRSHDHPARTAAPSQLQALAAASYSLPVHPTQLYAMINAALLWGVLAALFRVRRRHGVVFVALLLLYPPSRFVLEMIRADNPRDTLGMTISQFASVTMFIVGLTGLVLLYRFFPECSFHSRRGRQNAGPSGKSAVPS